MPLKYIIPSLRMTSTECPIIQQLLNQRKANQGRGLKQLLMNGFFIYDSHKLSTQNPHKNFLENFIQAFFSSSPGQIHFGGLAKGVKCTWIMSPSWIFWAIITANKIKGLSKPNDEYGIHSTQRLVWADIAENCEKFQLSAGK